MGQLWGKGACQGWGRGQWLTHLLLHQVQRQGGAVWQGR